MKKIKKILIISSLLAELIVFIFLSYVMFMGILSISLFLPNLDDIFMYGISNELSFIMQLIFIFILQYFMIIFAIIHTYILLDKQHLEKSDYLKAFIPVILICLLNCIYIINKTL